MQIVWFKRDLRVTDHKALAMAAEAGPVLPLYIVEPELWRQPDASLGHANSRNLFYLKMLCIEAKRKSASAKVSLK
uniref:deoxyribodipyrimidine photo-lyase n=2 Tax=Loktanella sp. S4079 TaxID=579483 RepID=UPI000A025234|nr:deoxyribodipyrimidine photo-lyase [Loktanella sp. S4079]